MASGQIKREATHTPSPGRIFSVHMLGVRCYRCPSYSRLSKSTSDEGVAGCGLGISCVRRTTECLVGLRREIDVPLAKNWSP